MFCLEVYVNNKKVAVVGKKDAQNYHATVTYWSGKNTVEVSANGASDVDENKISETFSWGKQHIATGDTVTIKVIDCENPDNPIEIDKHDHTEGMEELENLIVDAAAKYRVRAELEGTDFLKEEENPEGIYCSFCGKEKAEVKKMVGGPTVNICDECIVLCNEIIDGKSIPPKWPERD